MLDETRERDLAAALAELRERIERACVAAGRAPGEVALLPVTKNFPVSDVHALYRLGERSFGENRAQEAARKSGELAELEPGGNDVSWHMLGQVQRNKAASVARWASAVHSVDSVRLVGALSRAASAALSSGERKALLRMMIQVSLDGNPTRGGAAVDAVAEIAERIAASESLELRGLMAVPPLGMEPEQAFAELAAVRGAFLERFPGAVELSAGMSGDLEAAVRYGSTCVRVGTALLGRRPITSP